MIEFPAVAARTWSVGFAGERAVSRTIEMEPVADRPYWYAEFSGNVRVPDPRPQ
ncbi:hypothetical protein GCM10009548_46990 [Streptomyces malaysiensis subsp. malaysiensis]